MGLLDGKTALIFGVANDHSIAWGIAQALHAEGAEVGFSSVESLIEKRVRPLATSIGSTFVEPCDVQSDEQIRRASSRAGPRPTTRSTSSSTRSRSRGARTSRARFVDTSRDGFALALDISAYSLVALAREARPLLRRGSSVITLTYYGAEKVVANYNVMGVAKAALEASVRYLAADLGPDGDPRQRDQRRPRADAGGVGDRRLQGHVPRLRRHRSAARQHHARGRRPERASTSPRTSRARSPARCCTWTAGSTSWASRRATEPRTCRSRQPPSAIERRATRRTAAGDREMADVDREIAPPGERRDERPRPRRPRSPRSSRSRCNGGGRGRRPAGRGTPRARRRRGCG